MIAGEAVWPLWGSLYLVGAAPHVAWATWEPSAAPRVMRAYRQFIAFAPDEIAWRRARWHVFPFGMWTDPSDDERGRRWARDLCAEVRAWSGGSVYLNFIGDEGDDRVIAGLGADNHARLAAVRAKYDPNNVFHLNHNIRPRKFRTLSGRQIADGGD